MDEHYQFALDSVNYAEQKKRGILPNGGGCLVRKGYPLSPVVRQPWGVYAPVTEKTRPIRTLRILPNAISHRDGRSLTLINPAYMTRQYMSSGNSTQDSRHITSLSRAS
jgi:hypothetical protein